MVPVSTQVRVSTQARSDTAKRISGGYLVARALKAEGIKANFTLTAGHVMDIYNGSVDETKLAHFPIRCRHLAYVQKLADYKVKRDGRRMDQIGGLRKRNHAGN